MDTDNPDSTNSKHDGKKSFVWKYFKPPNKKNKVECLRCKKLLSYSGSTSGQFAHLKLVHGIIEDKANAAKKEIPGRQLFHR